MAQIQVYLVGGAVRDSFLGVDSKDKDYVVIAPSYEDMKAHLATLGAKIYVENPEYFTIRCKVEGLGDADFVLGRKDGCYSDGRRPDEVVICDTIEEELGRRDFRMNAIAKNVDTGEIIDPFNGVADIENGLIECVGEPMARFTEDYLRMLRALRFAITKNFEISHGIAQCLNNYQLVKNLRTNVSKERIREEMFRCFKYNTWETLDVLTKFPVVRDCLFYDMALWLKPTLEKR